jgi:hypothetical protein
LKNENAAGSEAFKAIPTKSEEMLQPLLQKIWKGKRYQTPGKQGTWLNYQGKVTRHSLGIGDESCFYPQSAKF